MCHGKKRTLFVGNHRSIPELASKIDINRETSVFLDHILPHLTRVGCRTTGDDHEPVDRSELPKHFFKSTELRASLIHHEPTPDRVLDRLGNIHDLLEEEMVVPFLLEGFDVPFYFLGRSLL